MVELAILFAAALAFSTGLLPELHSEGGPPPPFLEVLPYWVPWAGAVGGVGISLVGVAEYFGTNWDATGFAFWHLARPILGALFGTISVLIVFLLIKTVSTGSSGTPSTPQQTAVLTVIAFVVGFREETFRTLLRRVVDVIIGPGNTDATGVVSFVPAVVDFGEVATNSARSSRVVHLFNGSRDTLRITQAAVTSGDAALTVNPVIDTDSHLPAHSR